ncbi:hypothetical protein SCHPADRAFT_583092 [Schizopora paradoxa]|uniref:Uncharacterized protein n=1 Tax=Schizopora paradoxa TaxID=27342 RepID=A0A0H2RHQ8_9AGAM|nr:hypothetical protein SCHPADRAFT_583092 [Schizopora paradoxa]
MLRRTEDVSGVEIASEITLPRGRRITSQRSESYGKLPGVGVTSIVRARSQVQNENLIEKIAPAHLRSISSSPRAFTTLRLAIRYDISATEDTGDYSDFTENLSKIPASRKSGAIDWFMSLILMPVLTSRVMAEVLEVGMNEQRDRVASRQRRPRWVSDERRACAVCRSMATSLLRILRTN